MARCRTYYCQPLLLLLGGLLTFLALPTLSFGAKVLILHPLYSGSHVLTLRSVAEALASRGHSIRIVRWKDSHSFPARINDNITVTTLAMDNSEGQYAYLTRESQAAFEVPFEILWNSGLSIKSVIESYRAFPLMGGHCDSLLGNQRLRKELRKESFDIAIIDILYNECGLALLNDLGIPTVGYWAFPFASGEADYTTAFLPSSHVPAFLSKLGDEMTFFERTYNVLMKMFSHSIMWIHCTIVNKYIQKHMPGSPHPFDLLKNINGMLINTDYSLDYPRLLPPTFINCGGLQIRKPNPLPSDLEEWMQSSGEHGVILFTMGFIFNPKIVPKKLVNAFMQAFAKLPQKVLVKFDGPLDFVPPNVRVLTWIPQQDILAHPKTRVFLTHCGLHGVMEAIYFGVPMVGMPIFIDQGDVLVKMKEKGIAVGFSKDNATSEEIYDRLSEVLSDPGFKKRVTNLSKLMRDINETPLERVIGLLEFLIRHKGAEHLKLSSRHLNSLQYFCLDTLAFIFLVTSIIIYLIYRTNMILFKIFLYPYLRNVISKSSSPSSASFIISNNNNTIINPKFIGTNLKNGGRISNKITELANIPNGTLIEKKRD